jgi:hypothetical protein
MCANCGDFEIVGPGHPATRLNEYGQHEFFDRENVLKNCACPDDGAGSRPLKITLMGATAGLATGA